MVVWNVSLFGRTLVTVTDEDSAKRLCDVLNNGCLHGVEGEPAAYIDARDARKPTNERASYRQVRAQRPVKGADDDDME